MTPFVDIADAQRRAARIAARAQIRDVRLFSTTAQLVKPSAADDELSYDLERTAELEYDDGDQSFVVSVIYKLIVQKRRDDHEDSDDDEDAAKVAEIEFHLGGLFTLDMADGDEPPRRDEVQAYADSTGQLALYPFAREYVYNITGRLGLPALTIAVFQIPLANGDS